MVKHTSGDGPTRLHGAHTSASGAMTVLGRAGMQRGRGCSNAFSPPPSTSYASASPPLRHRQRFLGRARGVEVGHGRSPPAVVSAMVTLVRAPFHCVPTARSPPTDRHPTTPAQRPSHAPPPAAHAAHTSRCGGGGTSSDPGGANGASPSAAPHPRWSPVRLRSSAASDDARVLLTVLDPPVTGGSPVLNIRTAPVRPATSAALVYSRRAAQWHRWWAGTEPLKA